MSHLNSCAFSGRLHTFPMVSLPKLRPRLAPSSLPGPMWSVMQMDRCQPPLALWGDRYVTTSRVTGAAVVVRGGQPGLLGGVGSRGCGRGARRAWHAPWWTRPALPRCGGQRRPDAPSFPLFQVARTHSPCRRLPWKPRPRPLVGPLPRPLLRPLCALAAFLFTVALTSHAAQHGFTAAWLVWLPPQTETLPEQGRRLRRPHLPGP
uniref:Uncharacterized protein n=1 Tax=Myotis myotis TaxID=51298 RepID=A0A7J7RMC5_MYOMY|nr:hypothetical protein mMyoMyo1_010276 [Myotis myotis]